MEHTLNTIVAGIAVASLFAVSGCGGGGSASTASTINPSSSIVDGTVVVSAATVTTQNGSYIPTGGSASPVPSGTTAGINYATTDSKFEMEAYWDASSVVKTAHIWFSSGAPAFTISGYFGCNGTSEPCTGVTFNPATKKLNFTAVTFVETAGPQITDAATGSGKVITVNGSIITP